MRSTFGVLKLLAGLTAVTVIMALTAAPAAATHGESTPGSTVIAINPAGANATSDLQIVLTAHSEKSSIQSPSCRPQDGTLDCWGSLVLTIPDAGGLSVRNFEVHRVAVGDVSCDDENGGCEGHEVTPTASIGVDQPVQAVVNGVGVLRNPGATGQPVGTQVQVKMVLTDNGDAKSMDQVDVQVSTFVPGSVNPELYRSGPQTIQQVRIHLK